MSTNLSVLPEIKVLLTNLLMPESPRWHDGRLWLCNWCANEVIAVDLEGGSEIITRVPHPIPFCIDWLADGRLLVVSGPESLILRLEDRNLVTHADLRSVSEKGWNEIVVDGRNNIYVNGSPGIIALITPDGSVRQVADDIAFPNGMAVTPDNNTLIIAESHAKKLTAFDIASDGSLSNRRVWAVVDGPPDGICIDAEGALWYADVPNKKCVRVLEGGEVLQTIHLDRGCFSCALGGPDKKTLFMVGSEWRGMDKIAEVAQTKTGMVFTTEVDVSGAGWP